MTEATASPHSCRRDRHRRLTAATGIALGAAGAAGLAGVPAPVAGAAAPAPGVLAVVAGQEHRCAAPAPGAATSSPLCGDNGVATDDNGDLYIADPFNSGVEKVGSSGTLSVFAGRGSTNPLTCTASSPCPATSVAEFNPSGVAADANGNVYVADTSNNVVEKVTAAGRLSVFAGTGGGGAPTAGPATSSAVAGPQTVAVDSHGDVYIADSNNYIEMVTPSGTLSVIAGTGNAGAPTPGPATSSDLNGPSGLAVDTSGDVFVADYNNNVVEKITAAGSLSLFAGTGTPGTPTPGPATTSRLHGPSGVAVDGSDNVYVADTANNVVEAVTASGTLSLFAGTGTAGAPTPGPATSSLLHSPAGVAADASGDVYVADFGNQLVEEVGGSGPPTTVPSAPTQGVPVAGDAQVTVSWAPPASDGGSALTGYRVYAGTTSGGEDYSRPVCTTTSSSGSCVASSLQDGLTYDFTVEAVNGVGASSPSNEQQATPVAPARPDVTAPHYSIATSRGLAWAFGGDVSSGWPLATAPTTIAPIAGMASNPSSGGYWLAAADGGVFALNGAPFDGTLAPGTLTDERIVGITPTPDGRGYWLVGSDGGVFAFGDAGFHGSLGGRALGAPVVGMAATPDGGGYWLVGADGGVFAFGDAQFLGSMGGAPLQGRVVGVARTSDGQGYWLVGADGGVFAFGDAPFAGNARGETQGDAVVSITG